MKIGFDRNTEDIQLFGRTFKIASLTINDLIALDNEKPLKDEPKEHFEVHKMLLAITYALKINYELEPYTWTTNPFKYFLDAYRKARIKQILTYDNLHNKISMPKLVELNLIINNLDKFGNEDDKKKVKE